ncbi:MAG TPA: hypothetical protein VJG32_00620 [Anaerolineae bacterium]|nr:hypothetical protein [Anaerolineae bacterium]
MKRIFLIGIIPLVLLFGVGATFYALGYELGSGGAYTYQVHERKDGAVEVKIRLIPLLGSAALQNYERANVARIKALLARAGDPVEVQVTLRHPLAPDEVRGLAADAGLHVKSFLLVGQGANGEKSTSIVNADLSDIPAQEAGPRGQSIQYLGVMVLQGAIAPNADNLGRLVEDPRVYLVDTTMGEVRELVQR